MKLTNIQNRYINNKSLSVSILKGKKFTGKTLAAIYRVVNLENNYCIYDEDSILYITNNEEKLDNVKVKYKENKGKNYFYSLFSNEKDRAEFNSIKSLVKKYSELYKSKFNINKKIATKNEILTLINKDSIFINEIKELSKKSKVIKNSSLEHIYDELLWIKSCDFTEEEYLNVARTGRAKRINRNSNTRKNIYKLYIRYNELLKINNKYDTYDDALLANKMLKDTSYRYSHIIIDDCETLTRAELKFVKNLSSKNYYSTISFIVGTENNNSYGWLVAGRKLSTLDKTFKVKSFNLKTKFIKDIDIKDIDKEMKEEYEYINFKNRNISKFNYDSVYSEKQISLQDGINFMQNELVEIPIFNEIAAGNPIEINEGISGDFYLPKVWLERGKETFILNVKGDSMIGKNIYDGDLVVIKKQQDAYHNDIVAASVDGEATLKTLKTNGDNPTLMPENSRYKGISLIDKDVYILGIAIGVIRKK